MSVTVADLFKLPSLRQAKVLGGERGLGKTVSSISVLESVDPGVLVHEVFPQNKYSGSEIVITGFLNCIGDVDRQCSNLLRLIEGERTGSCSTTSGSISRGSTSGSLILRMQMILC